MESKKDITLLKLTLVILGSLIIIATIWTVSPSFKTTNPMVRIFTYVGVGTICRLIVDYIYSDI